MFVKSVFVVSITTRPLDVTYQSSSDHKNPEKGIIVNEMAVNNAALWQVHTVRRFSSPYTTSNV